MNGITVLRHRVPCAFAVCAACVFLAFGLPEAHAENVLSSASIFSPFVFVPGLRGEFKVSVIKVGIDRGSQIFPSQGIAWDLKRHFRLVSEDVFADVSASLRAGRLGVRVHADTREFVGIGNFLNNPNLPRAAARLEFSGIRLGADVDVLQWRGSRVGLNTDYCLYKPLFSEAIQTSAGGKKIIGDPPITGGFHIFLEPPVNVYGFSPVFEGWWRWPLLGAELTDMELSGGVRGIETVLGSMALKCGYRASNLEFPGLQLFNNVQVPTVFDASFSGWFLELAYYY